jgi:hypothetical protein
MLFVNWSHAPARKNPGIDTSMTPPSSIHKSANTPILLFVKEYFHQELFSHSSYIFERFLYLSHHFSISQRKLTTSVLIMGINGADAPLLCNAVYGVVTEAIDQVPEDTSACAVDVAAHTSLLR